MQGIRFVSYIWVKLSLMAIHLEYIPDRHYIRVTYKSPMPKGAMLHAVGKITDLAMQKGCFRVLADCRELKAIEDWRELHQIVEQMVQEGVPVTMREAVLPPQEEVVSKEVLLFETFTQNRGFTVRSFSHPDQALAWLTAE